MATPTPGLKWPEAVMTTPMTNENTPTPNWNIGSGSVAVRQSEYQRSLR
jgi:hypothetical protein